MNKVIVSFIENNLLFCSLFIILIVIYIVFEICSYWYQIKTKFRISSAQLVLLLNHHNATIIDLRSPQEFAAEHIINAINIPEAEFNENNLMGHNLNRPVILVDSDGQRSARYVYKLRHLGVPEVWYLASGLFGWKCDNMPVVSTGAAAVNNFINLANIIVYTKKDCPYCLGAKNLLKSNNYVYNEIEITDFNSKEYTEMLNLSNGAKTFPQIFINHQHIGGFQELKNLNDQGELVRITQQKRS